MGGEPLLLGTERQSVMADVRRGWYEEGEHFTVAGRHWGHAHKHNPLENDEKTQGNLAWETKTAKIVVWPLPGVAGSTKCGWFHHSINPQVE